MALSIMRKILPVLVLLHCTLDCFADISSSSENELLPENFTKAVEEFTYGITGLSKWSLFAKDCAGSLQSPINIDTTTTTRQHHPHLFWWNYHRRPQAMTLNNNGHTVVLSGQWTKNDVPYHWHTSGSDGSVEYYVLDHIHFHWGSSEQEGSEHRVNNIGYSLEMHAVHYNKQFKSLADALFHGHGIRVIAVFFVVSEAGNLALDNIVRWLPQIRNPSVIKVEPFEVGKLLVRFSQAFIMYNGSLTTPPCTEAVSWVIRLVPSTISNEQLEEFRKLMNHHGEHMSSNVRPVQKVNGRSIQHIY